MAGRGRTIPSEFQSSYFPPLSKPSSSALVRALPRRPDPRPMVRTPVGADLATADFAWPSPRQWRDPKPYLGMHLNDLYLQGCRCRLSPGALQGRHCALPLPLDTA